MGSGRVDPCAYRTQLGGQSRISSSLRRPRPQSQFEPPLNPDTTCRIRTPTHYQSHKLWADVAHDNSVQGGTIVRAQNHPVRDRHPFKQTPISCPTRSIANIELVIDLQQADRCGSEYAAYPSLISQVKTAHVLRSPVQNSRPRNYLVQLLDPCRLKGTSIIMPMAIAVPDPRVEGLISATSANQDGFELADFHCIGMLTKKRK